MASGCLVMIREDLEAMVGEDKMIGVPPMMYNDVIRTIYAQKEAALADQRRYKWLRDSAMVTLYESVTVEGNETLYEGRIGGTYVDKVCDAALTADGGGATAIGGVRIVADETIPPNTAHIFVGNNHVGTITDLDGGGV